LERKICFDRATLDNKILLDDDQYLVMPAVIASEIVHKYPEGWAYKPADELEKATWTADHRWVKILSHPDTALLQTAQDIYGIVENPKYVKDLIDPKTKRPCRKGIRADIKWFKDKVPAPVIEQIKAGELRGVSIGFTFEQDMTPGEYQGTHYDFIQRNIFIDHVAAPIEEGRCPGPLCGIAVDSVVKFTPKVEGDKVVKRGNKWCVVHCHGEQEGEVIKCFNTEAEAQAMHRAIQARKHDISLRNQGEKPPAEWMEKCKAVVNEGMPSYSEEQVNAVCGNIWYHKPEQHGIGDIPNDCPICQEIKRVGLVESAKRLAIAYGKDVIYIIKGETPKPVETTEDILGNAKKAIESSRWLFEK